MKHVVEQGDEVVVPRAEPLECLLPELWSAHILTTIPIQSYPRTCVALMRTCRWLYWNVPGADWAEWPYGYNGNRKFWTGFNQEVAALIAENTLVPLSWPLSIRFRLHDMSDCFESNYIAALAIPLRMGRADAFTMMARVYWPECMILDRHRASLLEAATEGPNEECISRSLSALRSFIRVEEHWLRVLTSLFLVFAEKERYIAFECIVHDYFDAIMRYIDGRDSHRDHVHSVFET